MRNDKGTHHYVYDDKGERILKSSVLRSDVYVNDQIVNTIQDLEPYTLYVNPYFVVTEFSNADKVSKHYYMGTQRVASELAVQTTSYSPLVSSSGSTISANSSTETFKTKTSTTSTVESGLEPQNLERTSNPWLNNLNEALTEFGQKPLTLEETQKDLPTIESIYPDLSSATSNKTTSGRVIYWYHPDYIGNVDLVSDYSGEVYEFFLYNPWGENLYEWNSGTASFSSPYRFNSKELDQETGLTYYGARYYDNQISQWLSVDRLAAKYPNSSPYVFSGNNPLMLVDPNGDSLIIQLAGDLDRSYSTILTNDLSDKTGLELSLNDSGRMEYAKDSNGDPIIRKDANGATIGSQVARDELTGIINSEENSTDILVSFSRNDPQGSHSMLGSQSITLDPDQLSYFMNNTHGGLEPTTMGYGLAFFHEYWHSIGISSEEDVMHNVNIIRSQLGSEYGQRLIYSKQFGTMMYTQFAPQGRTIHPKPSMPYGMWVRTDY